MRINYSLKIINVEIAATSPTQEGAAAKDVLVGAQVELIGISDCKPFGFMHTVTTRVDFGLPKNSPAVKPVAEIDRQQIQRWARDALVARKRWKPMHDTIKRSIERQKMTGLRIGKPKFGTGDAPAVVL